MSAYGEILYGLNVLEEARRLDAMTLAITFIGDVQKAMTASGQGPWIPDDEGFARIATHIEEYLKGDGSGTKA
jgi:hypothetical protein